MNFRHVQRQFRPRSWRNYSQSASLIVSVQLRIAKVISENWLREWKVLCRKRKEEEEENFTSTSATVDTLNDSSALSPAPKQNLSSAKGVSQRETFRLQQVDFYLPTRNRYDNGREPSLTFESAGRKKTFTLQARKWISHRPCIGRRSDEVLRNNSLAECLSF